MCSAYAPNPPGESLRFGIAFGSNLGDRLANLSAARRQLLAASSSPDSALFSPVFESAPVDCPAGSKGFYNAVAELELALQPLAALELCQQIETELGRPAVRKRHSPRSIDLDLLYVGSSTVDSERLVIPHPRLAGRRFVLEPLAAIRPELILPRETQAIGDLLQNLFSDEPPLARVTDDW